MVDIEEIIPALIALFAVLGFIGFLGEFILIINEVPYLFSVPHYCFTTLGGFIDQYVVLGVNIWAVILEVIIAILFAYISYEVGM